MTKQLFLEWFESNLTLTQFCRSKNLPVIETVTKFSTIKRIYVCVMGGKIYLNNKPINDQRLPPAIYYVSPVSENYCSPPRYKPSEHRIGKLLSREDLSINEIAKMLGVTKQRVSEINIRHGIRPPKNRYCSYMRQSEVTRFYYLHGLKETALKFSKTEQQIRTHVSTLRRTKLHKFEVKDKKLFLDDKEFRYLDRAFFIRMNHD